ncbi:hypothetical protein GCM10027511_22010 [Hymenobacter humi]
MLWLSAKTFIVAVFYISIIKTDLPVRAVFDAIRRVEIKALYTTSHALALEQGSHNQLRVTLY